MVGFWFVNGIFDVLISLVWLVIAKIRFGLETLVLGEVILVELGFNRLGFDWRG